MRRQSIHALMGIGLLALGVCAAAAPALAQSSYYPSARKLNDNGSVNEPGPAAGTGAAAQRPARDQRLVNQAPAPQRGFYPSDRKPNDNGSVDEPGPTR